VTIKPRYLVVFYRWTSRAHPPPVPQLRTRSSWFWPWWWGWARGSAPVGFERSSSTSFEKGFDTLAATVPLTERWPWLGRIPLPCARGPRAPGRHPHPLRRPRLGRTRGADVMAGVGGARGAHSGPGGPGDSVTAGICIGSGGSAGPEGPHRADRSAIGSTVGQAIRMSTERLRILTAWRRRGRDQRHLRRPPGRGDVRGGGHPRRLRGAEPHRHRGGLGAGRGHPPGVLFVGAPVSRCPPSA